MTAVAYPDHCIVMLPLFYEQCLAIPNATYFVGGQYFAGIVDTQAKCEGCAAALGAH